MREEDLLRKTLVVARIGSSHGQAPAISPALPKRENNDNADFLTFTTVNPQNQYKKVVALSNDKELDGFTCSWQRAYQNVKKFKLF